MYLNEDLVVSWQVRGIWRRAQGKITISKKSFVKIKLIQVVLYQLREKGFYRLRNLRLDYAIMVK